MDEPFVEEPEDGPPAPVFIALLVSYALAGTLLAGGLIGLLTWNAVGDPAGVLATILGLLVAVAAFLAWRRSRAGRGILTLMAGASAVFGAVYMFTGPGSAFIGSLVIAALGAATVALLHVPEASKQFFAD